ncbi:hypothetical protein [Paenibacillus alvei]|nr:hypothetical protein [Paenibacillus alvei]
MKEWAMEHPYLTTFLFLAIICVVEVGITNFARAFAIRSRKGRE